MSSGVSRYLRLGLQHHLVEARVLRELAHVQRAEHRLQRAVGILHRHAEHFGLLAVDVGEQLLAVGADGGVDAGQLRPRRAPWR